MTREERDSATFVARMMPSVPAARPRRGPYRPEAPLRLVKPSPWVPEPPKVRSKFAYAQAELVDGVEPWPDRAGLPMRWTVTREGESHIVTKGARGLRCSCGGQETATCYHIALVGRLETNVLAIGNTSERRRA